MSVVSQKFIKVTYPRKNSLFLYKILKQVGNRLHYSFKSNQIKRIISQVLSVVKPSGRVFLIPKPKSGAENTGTRMITFMSANLWHDWPRNRKLMERLECFVQLVLNEHVDILLVQELIRTNDFQADKWLSEKLGMAYIYSRSNGNDQGIGFEEGLAIFSRFPIKNHRLAQLSDPTNPFSRRMALATNIETEWGDFDVYSVHLGILSSQNRAQLSRLQAWVDEQSGRLPAVIGGDFNAHEDTPQMRSVQRTWRDSYRFLNPSGKDHSHELRWPWGNIIRKSRLDYLFFRQESDHLIIDEARYIDTFECPLSDHRPVLAKATFNQI